MILLDSIIKVNKKHYPQILLEECKYAGKKAKNIISDELELDKSLRKIP